MAENKDNNKNNSKENKWKKVLFMLVPILMLIAVFVLGIFMANSKKNDENNVAYTQLIKDVNDGKIEKNRNDSRKYFCKNKI